jgi:hypothetical protein
MGKVGEEEQDKKEDTQRKERVKRWVRRRNRWRRKEMKNMDAGKKL